MTVESLRKVFDENGWPDDLSFKKQDFTTLLESLGIDESTEEELSCGISDLVDRMHDRAAGK